MYSFSFSASAILVRYIPVLHFQSPLSQCSIRHRKHSFTRIEISTVTHTHTHTHREREREREREEGRRESDIITADFSMKRRDRGEAPFQCLIEGLQRMVRQPASVLVENGIVHSVETLATDALAAVRIRNYDEAHDSTESHQKLCSTRWHFGVFLCRPRPPLRMLRFGVRRTSAREKRFFCFCFFKLKQRNLFSVLKLHADKSLENM